MESNTNQKILYSTPRKNNQSTYNKQNYFPEGSIITRVHCRVIQTLCNTVILDTLIEITLKSRNFIPVFFRFLFNFRQKHDILFLQFLNRIIKLDLLFSSLFCNRIQILSQFTDLTFKLDFLNNDKNKKSRNLINYSGCRIVIRTPD